MIIVAGSLHVASEHRAAYLEGCEAVVAAARAAPGCLDFALSGDLLDAGRVNVFERWDSAESLECFRGSGSDEGQLAVLREIRVSEYELAR
jgi:quinol monooxygenase YgiN